MSHWKEVSREVRLLANRWAVQEFPKMLRSLVIKNIRGWTGQQIEFKFPIVAIVGENGIGKSTILQAAASVYKSPVGSRDKWFYPTSFFPDTAWDEFTDVEIKATMREGDFVREVSIRKPTTRWRGYDTRRERHVYFLDLKRIIPIYAREGYSRLAKRQNKEKETAQLDDSSRKRLSSILGKDYLQARHSTTEFDDTRKISVFKFDDREYSGYHQGAGEGNVVEILERISSKIPDHSLVLIDEIETSLHPRSQRRLIRALAEVSRTQQIQFIVTTHSPYILNELPLEARILIINGTGNRRVVPRVSTEFALSQMDDKMHPEIDVFVEDTEAQILVEEIIAAVDLSLLPRVRIIPYGAASVGKALGMMCSEKRFPRPTLVIIDGDQNISTGCFVLPGDDALERVIYPELLRINMPNIADNLARHHAAIIDACQTAITAPDHHTWNQSVANRIVCGSKELWRAMCRSWVKNLYQPNKTDPIVTAIRNAIDEKAAGD